MTMKPSEPMTLDAILQEARQVREHNGMINRLVRLPDCTCQRDKSPCLFSSRWWWRRVIWAQSGTVEAPRKEQKHI